MWLRLRGGVLLIVYNKNIIKIRRVEGGGVRGGKGGGVGWFEFNFSRFFPYCFLRPVMSVDYSSLRRQKK